MLGFQVSFGVCKGFRAPIIQEGLRLEGIKIPVFLKMQKPTVLWVLVITYCFVGFGVTGRNPKKAS